jgi:hypothetical protein
MEVRLESRVSQTECTPGIAVYICATTYSLLHALAVRKVLVNAFSKKIVP